LADITTTEPVTGTVSTTAATVSVPGQTISVTIPAQTVTIPAQTVQVTLTAENIIIPSQTDPVTGTAAIDLTTLVSNTSTSINNTGGYKEVSVVGLSALSGTWTPGDTLTQGSVTAKLAWADVSGLRLMYQGSPGMFANGTPANYQYPQAIAAKYPLIMTEFGSYSSPGCTGDPNDAMLLTMADAAGIGYTAWTFDASQEPTLLYSNSTSMPSEGYGLWYQRHCQRLAGLVT
jgi:hypothetical protein